MLDADFLNCRLPEGQSFTTIVKHKQIYVDKTDVKDALDCPKNSFLNCQLF